MHNYCVNFGEIVLHIQAEDSGEAIKKAKEMVIQKIQNAELDWWPDYDKDELEGNNRI